MAYVQPAANTAVGRAKRLLREVTTANVEGGDEIAIVSGLDGAPLFQIGDFPDRLTLTIGQGPSLILIGRIDPIPQEFSVYAKARFSAWHGTGQRELSRLDPTSAVLEEDGVRNQIQLEDLITGGGGDLSVYERRAVDHMNDDHRDAIRHYAETLLGAPAADWVMAGLDMDGIDMVADGSSCRLWFDPPLKQASEVRPRLVELAMAGRT